MPRRGVRILLFLLVLLAPAVARAASLDGARATLQFAGTMTTQWSIPNESSGMSECFNTILDGAGRQTLHYQTHGTHGRAAVNIVDAGSSIAFQLDQGDRATPHRRGIGFDFAPVVREGSLLESQESEPGHPPFCGAPAPPSAHDQSGCGHANVPWDAQPIVSGGEFLPTVTAFVPVRMMVKCPFFPVPIVGGQDTGSMPQNTHARIGLAKVRRALGRRGGKLIVRGTQSWHSIANQGLGVEIQVTTRVSWKATLIRGG